MASKRIGYCAKCASYGEYEWQIARLCEVCAPLFAFGDLDDRGRCVCCGCDTPYKPGMQVLRICSPCHEWWRRRGRPWPIPPRVTAVVAGPKYRSAAASAASAAARASEEGDAWARMTRRWRAGGSLTPTTPTTEREIEAWREHQRHLAEQDRAWLRVQREQEREKGGR